MRREIAFLTEESNSRDYTIAISAGDSAARAIASGETISGKITRVKSGQRFVRCPTAAG